MGLRRKPHTVVWTPQSNSHTGARVDAPRGGSPRTFRGQITPTSPDQAYRQFGIESVRPHILMTDLADGEHIKIGDQILSGGREFYVRADPMVWNAGRITDHCDVLITQEQQ